ncbi:dTMP kinase [Limnoglobus roseus]|uniref:Thymidylate kinase n=1 Tax=Limnoglobus roseus TaxID=2598579 RepID=A0A5C1ANT9_9BACT|nr:dTMP kinase [Limnoglobus roseus]QEL19676.1 dTMP kinase [Limnoglobus roseus]
MPDPTFIALDGLDGTGKSTQVRRLADWLRDQHVPVTTCVDPGGTELGAKLREILLHGRANSMNARTEALLFMASRAELVSSVIQPALARGDVVLSDRYLLANVVYQGHAGGLDPAELWTVGRFSTFGVTPDLTLVFDLPPDVARQRRGRPSDRMESRGSAFDDKVREGFLVESRANPTAIEIIDVMPDPDTVHAAVRKSVERLLLAKGYLLPGG